MKTSTAATAPGCYFFVLIGFAPFMLLVEEVRQWHQRALALSGVTGVPQRNRSEMFRLSLFELAPRTVVALCTLKPWFSLIVELHQDRLILRVVAAFEGDENGESLVESSWRDF